MQKLICTFLALGLTLFYIAPAQAQYPNYWPSPGTGGYYNGTGIYNPLAGYSPYTYGPQFGYSAGSYGRPPSTGLGMGIGLAMYGGMAAVGAVMVGSRMIANRNLYKNNNPNPNASNSDKKKDKQAKSERRRNQELKIKGQLDADYQKELAEKGLTPSSMPGLPAAPGGATAAPQSLPAAMNGMSTPQPQSMGAQSYNPPPAAGGGYQAPPTQNYAAPAMTSPEPAPILNTPWSPDAIPPSF